MKEGVRKFDLETLFSKHTTKEILGQLIQALEEKDIIDLKEITTSPQIPLSIFSYNLHPSEALCKYLKEQHWTNQDIAKALNRNPKTIWGTLQRAQQRHPRPFKRQTELYHIPLSTFQTNLTLMEALILHLNSKGLSNPEIAQLLNKSRNSIATLSKRAKHKEDHGT